MADWTMVRLEELAANEKSAISKPYGSAIRKEDYRSEGVPVVRGVNLARGIFHDDDFVFIEDGLANRMPGAELKAGDLVVTHRGTVGQVSMIPRTPAYERYVASTSHVKVRLDFDRAVPEFYYYWFSSPAGKRSILENASTVGVPGIAQPVATVKRLLVPHPNLSAQYAIAEVLGALDEKIAANNRLVHAVNDYLACVLDRLCVGAAFDTLRKIASVSTSVKRPVLGGNLRYLDISAVSAGTYDLPPVTNWEQAPGRARRAIKAGDTVWSTVRPNRKSHALVLDDDPLLVGSTGLAVLSPKKGRTACTFESSRREEFVQYLEGVAEGSAYPAVRVDRFNEAPVPALHDDQWDHFESIAFPLRKRSHAATVENRWLAATRDELLPLLMSGKIHVREAEKVVEGVV
ncbi:restriction endonuclease subunit S [Amycolatopsis thermoflava]|uniref:restriction endonuclease subunit S n=1 Tax=Amycolatopsis thermoflava TaxID=84480 RepID=UPI00365BEF60